MCCHPAQRLQIKNVEMSCIDLIKGSTDGIIFDAYTRTMKTIVTATCGVVGCGKELHIETITYHESENWSKVIYF